MIARATRAATTAQAIGPAAPISALALIANPINRKTNAVARNATNSQTVSSASSVRSDRPSLRP